MSKKKSSGGGGSGVVLLIIVVAVVYMYHGGKIHFPKSVGSLASVGGNYSCSALETLWTSNGGSPGAAFTMAEIARAESGGKTVALAHEPDGSLSYGLWQINSNSGGSFASYDPGTNVSQAIGLYNSRGYEPWSTWKNGAYAGQC